MFSYGMNTNKNQMASRCPNAIPIGYAILPGHCFRFSGCADIVPNSHTQVDGVLWEITDQCLAALDCLEGYPRYYNRKTVLVKSKDQFYKSLVYFMIPGNEDWPPSQSYYQTIVDGYDSFNVPKYQITKALKSLTEQTI
jgi:gamma-glutamylcyclotransferase